MGKIFNGLSKEILTAMKSGEKTVIDVNNVVTKANALRNLKAKLLEFKTSADGAKIVNANNGEIPDANEIVVVKKYVKELQSDMELYASTNVSLSKSAKAEMDYLNVYLPKEATESDIRVAVVDYISKNGSYEQKQMGQVIKSIKSKFDNVDGGLVAKIVKEYINK